MILHVTIIVLELLPGVLFIIVLLFRAWHVWTNSQWQSCWQGFSV